jgi:hypothetical protein
MTLSDRRFVKSVPRASTRRSYNRRSQRRAAIRAGDHQNVGAGGQPAERRHGLDVKARQCVVAAGAPRESGHLPRSPIVEVERDRARAALLINWPRGLARIGYVARPAGRRYGHATHGHGHRLEAGRVAGSCRPEPVGCVVGDKSDEILSYYSTRRRQSFFELPTDSALGAWRPRLSQNHADPVVSAWNVVAATDSRL